MRDWRFFAGLAWALFLPVFVLYLATSHFLTIAWHPDFDIHSDDLVLLERCLDAPGIVPIDPDMPVSALKDIPGRSFPLPPQRLYWHGIDHPSLHRWVFHYLMKWEGVLPETLPAGEWDYSMPARENIALGRVAPEGARRLVRTTNGWFMVAAALLIYVAAAKAVSPMAGLLCAVAFTDPWNVLGHTVEIVWSLGQDPLLWMLMSAALALWAFLGASYSGAICVGIVAGLATCTKLNGAFFVAAFCAWLLLKRRWRLAILAGGVSFAVFIIVNPVVWSRGVLGAPRVLMDFVAWGRMRAPLYAASFGELEGRSWLGARLVILGRFRHLWLLGMILVAASPRMRRLNPVVLAALAIALFHLVTVPAPAPRYVFAIQTPILMGLVAAWWPTAGGLQAAGKTLASLVRRRASEVLKRDEDHDAQS